MLFLILLHSMLNHTYGAPISYLDTTACDFTISSTCPDPTTRRTTWTIIKSCLATVFLCTWVAVHPNIPAPADTRAAIFFRRLKIMFWALMAPELVIFWAMRQWFGARKVVESFKAHAWTRTHAHFAQMGGFILYKDNEPLRTPSPDELAHLSQTKEIDFPNISEQEIEDRSKGDLISRGLVIIQTSWFVIQCIARGIEGMVITEIEVVTLAFAVLNGILYFFWWNKPLDVRCAVPVHLKLPKHPAPTDGLSGGHNTDNGALESPRSATDASQEHNPRGVNMDPLPNQDRLAEILSPEFLSVAVENENSTKTETPHAHDSHRPTSMAKPTGVLHALFNFISPIIATIIRTCISLHADFKLHTWSWLIANWILLPILMSVLDPISQMVESRPVSIEPSATRTPTFYAVATHRGHHVTMLLITTGIATLTGAIHCTIWSFPFPSRVEEVLWRSAAALVTAFPLALVCISVVFFVAPDINENSCALPPVLAELFHTVVMFVGFLGFVSALVYVVGRLSLLVQALISLRDIPAAAFETVDWNDVLPHL